MLCMQACGFGRWVENRLWAFIKLCDIDKVVGENDPCLTSKMMITIFGMRWFWDCWSKIREGIGEHASYSVSHVNLMRYSSSSSSFYLVLGDWWFIPEEYWLIHKFQYHFVHILNLKVTQVIFIVVINCYLIFEYNTTSALRLEQLVEYCARS